MTTVVLLMTAGIFLGSNLNQAIIEAQMKKQISQEQILQAKAFTVGGLLIFTSMVMAVGYVINMIATRKFRRERKRNPKT